jgi:hypothetical protein
MDNHPANSEARGILQLKSDDFYNYGVTCNDGFYYTLAMHKTARLLLFEKIAENTTESEIGGHCIWVLIHMADTRFWIRIMQLR